MSINYIFVFYQNYLIMRFLISIVITAFLIAGCTSDEKKVDTLKVEGLLENVDKYVDKEVVVEGRVVHVCSYDCRKMKLIGDNGQIVKIEPGTLEAKFDKEYKGKTLAIKGVVSETRITEDDVKILEDKKTTLCHIDKEPCLDGEYIDRLKAKKKNLAILNRQIDGIREQLKASEKGYISMVTVKASDITVIPEPEDSIEE